MDSRFDIARVGGYVPGMASKPLSLEQQRAYVQAWKQYGPVLEQIKVDEARARTEAEKWEDAQVVQLSGEGVVPELELPENPEEHGLVIQQRYFMKLHRR